MGEVRRVFRPGRTWSGVAGRRRRGKQNDEADDGADDDHDGDFRIVEAARGGNERGAEIAPGGGETQDTAHLRF